jgi:putative ABC transport system permease protein
VAFELSATGQSYEAPEASTAFYKQLYARLSQMRNIESAGLTSHLPMFNFGYNGEFQIEGTLPWSANDAPLVEYRWFYGDYMRMIGIRLLKGRMLDDRLCPVKACCPNITSLPNNGNSAFHKPIGCTDA